MLVKALLTCLSLKQTSKDIYELDVFFRQAPGSNPNGHSFKARTAI